MTIQEMAATAREHWKQYPKTYKKMVKNGHLISESEAAARLTKSEMDALMLIGHTEAEAWQASRCLFILIDPAKEYRI